MKKIMTLMLAVFMLMVSTCFAADVEGKVDWDGNIIQTVGVGSAPENVVNPAMRHQIARRTAMLDGYRNLLELVKGINIDSSTTVSTLSTPKYLRILAILVYAFALSFLFTFGLDSYTNA